MTSKLSKKKAVELLDNQLKKLYEIDEAGDYFKIPQWKNRTKRMLKDIIIYDELVLLTNIELDDKEEEIGAYESLLFEFIDGIENEPKRFLIQNKIKSTEDKPIGNSDKQNDVSKKVFIVHGHDKLSKTEVARTVEKLDLEAIILHERANQGETVIEKIERYAPQVSFAIVLLTPDDCGYQKDKPNEIMPRARQNVILELGYFSGILGRTNICVLYKDGVEIPSDLLGVVYIPFDDEGAWKFDLGKELNQAGMPIDMNNLI